MNLSRKAFSTKKPELSPSSPSNLSERDGEYIHEDDFSDDDRMGRETDRSHHVQGDLVAKAAATLRTRMKGEKRE